MYYSQKKYFCQCILLNELWSFSFNLKLFVGEVGNERLDFFSPYISKDIFLFLIFFGGGHATRHMGSQFPDQRSEIKSMLLAVEAQILNRWTSRKSPKVVSCILVFCLFVCFWTRHTTWMSVPQPGIEPRTTAVKAVGPN